ncbi:putative AraC family transcriptional regulator [Kineosphaera limosa NBRC 100340]|uniref:Putative AraC family transcriptional regulator n=1 Tax=Kineosphaera limosa NBRC 100340 TaxID=1184609 RepID=K6WC95_9MICO|nr:AraC family transcriptional regulator [Kineosphaera limosa]GAB96875.1 putative AraC family transcriptional regulator [Kineosphaera limosa NBRC 100340]
MIRAAALRGFAPLVTELGGEPAEYLQRAGLDPAVLGDDEALVPVERFAAALALAGAELDCPHLGLLLSQRQDLEVLGPLAVVLESAPTMGEALHSAERFLFVHSSTAGVQLLPDPRGEPGVIAVELTPADMPLGLELGLGLLHRIAGMFTGGDYGLRGVHLPGPPVATESVYAQVFGAPVRFRTGRGLLRVPATLPEQRLRTGDELLHRMAVQYLETNAATHAATTSGQVTRVLAGSLSSNVPLIGTVAGLLGLHPRTLQRRLAAEGTTFAQVLDEVRRDRAYYLIVSTDLPFRQISAQVGLSDPAALTRACRRWFAAPPRALRQAASGAGSPTAPKSAPK